MHVSTFFFFNDTATTEIYTLSLHDALPIYRIGEVDRAGGDGQPHQSESARQYHHDRGPDRVPAPRQSGEHLRSEEHTSELQSRSDLVCRLLLEKKKK